MTEQIISGDRAVQLTEWLKSNVWPQSQVAAYMEETVIHRAKWIRANVTKAVVNIMMEFPRLVDTPGMVSLHLKSYV